MNITVNIFFELHGCLAIDIYVMKLITFTYRELWEISTQVLQTEEYASCFFLKEQHNFYYYSNLLSYVSEDDTALGLSLIHI